MSNNNGDNTFSFSNAELEILKFWADCNIFKKSLDTNKDFYSFYDGPPFATGLPHYGHLLAGTIKDVIPRFFTMNGFHVERTFGWDCHGLPIEYEIDKKLGMSAQEAVNSMGIKAYNDECRAIVQRYTSEWKETVTRLGRWVDFDNGYKTMDADFMESVWWTFNELYSKGLIYCGLKVVPYSMALQTTLSNFEASSNYQDVMDTSAIVLFKIIDQNFYIAAWTTTPWTLPANTALCVNAKTEYVKIQNKKGLTFFIAKDRLQIVNEEYTILESILGSELVGLSYEPLFNYVNDLNNNSFKVVSDDYVTTSSGTGVVHIAPFYGEDDYRIAKKYNICAVDVLTDTGHYKEFVKNFSGLYIKDAEKLILKYLKETGHLYRQEQYKHSYPFCPRSDTPLIYKAVSSWYVNVESIKSKLISANAEINWTPAHIKNGRFGKWLENANDWSISRNRIWGTPIPLWINDKTGNICSIGSIEQLSKCSGVTVIDLHRENIDNITFSMPNEEGTYKRITDVFDCWFESGAMPYAQMHYPFENVEKFEKSFPANFIAEGIDQTRGWFYTLTVLAAALFDKPAFKNVIVNGIVLAEDGRKMSKRLKNYPDPTDIVTKYGADALRLYLVGSSLTKGEGSSFSDNGVKEIIKKIMLPWQNAFNFLTTYTEIDNWKPSFDQNVSNNILDKWILSKMQTLKEELSFEIKSYQLYNVNNILSNFLDDLTNWYIRLNRSRFWSNENSADKHSAYETLFTVLLDFAKLTAPLTPFFSEYSYKKLIKDNNFPESVHLCKYPQFDLNLYDASLEKSFLFAQNVIILSRQARVKKQIKTKIPLKSIELLVDASIIDKLINLEDYLKSEINVKNITYSSEKSKFINFFVKPNYPILGKKAGKNIALYKSVISNLNDDNAILLLNGKEICVNELILSPEDVIIAKISKSEDCYTDNDIAINFDFSLSKEQIEDGFVRELISQIQKMRKTKNFNIVSFINVEISTNLNDIFAKYKNIISGEILMNDFSITNSLDSNIKVENLDCYINITEM